MSNGPLDRIAWRPMYAEVRDRLVAYIEENGLWGDQLISERELAEIFAVSRGTVRKGIQMLEGEGVVSSRAGRRARVLPRPDRVEEEDDLTITVAAFGPKAGGLYGAQIIAGMSGGGGDIGALISTLDLRSAENRKLFFEKIRRGDIDGVLLLSLTDRATVCQILDTSSVPVVLADHHFADVPVTSVVDDSEDGARQAVRHLISRGHRRIGYIEIIRREWNPWRYAGYAGALEDAGIDVDERLIEPAIAFEGALAATAKLLSLPDLPTAVFAFDDARAWGAWTAAELRGLEVGRDFAIVGYGDRGAEGGPWRDLSSVGFSPRDIGRVAVEELGRLIRRETSPGELIKIPAELKVRKSSAEARVGSGQ